MVSISRYSKFNFAFYPIFTKEDPRTGNPMDFTSEYKDKVIREAVSQKQTDLYLIHLTKFVETQIKIKLQLHHSRLVTLSYKQMRDIMRYWSC